MLHFHVTGMTCGACVNKITQAIKTIDTHAQIVADVKTGRLEINSTQPATLFKNAILDLGYQIK